MDRGRDTVRTQQRLFCERKGVALILAFSVSLLILTLIASLFWVMAHRHTLARKRFEHARVQHLVEAGMHDAIARLRIGIPPPGGVGIDPAVGRWYCLNIDTSTPTDIPNTCTATCPAGQVRVCVSDNSGGRNQIDVTTNF